MEIEIYRGNLYYANLDPVIGSEQGGTRPVVVLQNKMGNRYSPTVAIAPVTSRLNKMKNLPTHVFIKARGKLRYDSIVLVEQTRVIDKSRIDGCVGKLTEEEMLLIDNAIIEEFGIEVDKILKENI